MEKYKEINGRRKWSSSLTVPSFALLDKSDVDRLKRQLKIRCIEEYVDNVEDSFVYNISSDKITRTSVITITMDDLFSIKNHNKKLSRELSELVDMYIVLRDTMK